MSQIRSQGMKPELVVRSMVHRLGYRFRLHRRDMAGKPDLVLSRHRAVIFVNGCFWHWHPDLNCPIAGLPKSNVEYWEPKLARTRIRLESTEDEDGEVSYGFQAFSGGSNPFAMGTDGANMSSLKGSATYAGPAGGMYVHKSLTADGGVASATSGAFTANAKLTANFGGPNVAERDWFSISGIVNNFRDGTTKLDWSLDLMRADFATRGTKGAFETAGQADFTGQDGTFAGDTTGGGSWNGQFFGDSAPDVDTTDVNESIMPSGVAGEFNGHFVNGHVNGAFGATLQ